jgi:hypothetical protein
MKKTVFFMLALLVGLVSFSQTWENFGPEGIDANKICLLDDYDYNRAIICTDAGFYFTPTLWMPVWEFFEFPVKGAANLDENNILVVLGEGSYSDGIYKFDITTHEIDVISYCIYPDFILKRRDDARYFVGYESGLVESTDGITWTSVSAFNNKTCIDMAYFPGSEYLAVATNSAVDNVYYSEDDGANWTQMQSSFQISELLFDPNGNLTGICSESTSNNGFYKRNGTQWENLFYAEKVNALGCDNTGTPFKGWYGADDKGIARYKSSELIFFDEGLPSLNINDIPKPLAQIGGNIVFCCTEEGVFYNDDYATRINTVEPDIQQMALFPNPVRNNQLLHIQPTVNSYPYQIVIYSQKGIPVKRINGETSRKESISIDVNDLKKGLYFIHFINEEKRLTTKFIKL